MDPPCRIPPSFVGKEDFFYVSGLMFSASRVDLCGIKIDGLVIDKSVCRDFSVKQEQVEPRRKYSTFLLFSAGRS